MIENDRYYRRYVKDINSGYIYLQTGLVKKAILNSLFEIKYRLTIQIAKDKNLLIKLSLRIPHICLWWIKHRQNMLKD